MIWASRCPTLLSTYCFVSPGFSLTWDGRCYQNIAAATRVAVTSTDGQRFPILLRALICRVGCSVLRDDLVPSGLPAYRRGGIAA